MKLPKHPLIETERLVLRLVEKADLTALFAVNGDKKVFRYSPRVHWKKAVDGKAWFSRIMTHRKNGATIQFVIVLRESGHPIGTFAVFNFDESVGSAEIGYVLGRKYWGKGLIKEALAAFVPFAFGTLKLKRLEAELDPRNIASAKALERVGFTHEGCRRSNYYSKGEISDTGLYGMLRDDPRPAIRSASAAAICPCEICLGSVNLRHDQNSVNRARDQEARQSRFGRPGRLVPGVLLEGMGSPNRSRFPKRKTR